MTHENAIFRHVFRHERGQAATPGASHHNRGARPTATSLRWHSLLLASTFAAASTLGCHPPEKFPAPALAASPPSPKFEFFEAKASGLDDELPLTDLSALNAEPAGAHGFVRAERGHFVDERGARLRFFGVNLSGAAGLPDHASAVRLARHLRKLGFNAVRLNALDAPGALLNKGGELDPEALRRLDDFSAELKAQGLYFSLVLHALRAYPGLAGEALSRFPTGSILDRFHAPFLDAQREFARALLDRVNFRTQRKYSDEPALLYVELNDEDSIFPSATASTDDLPPDYRAELARGYAAWLGERTAEGLRAPRPAEEEAIGALPTFHDSPSARADYAQYLADTERREVRTLANYVRRDIGLRSMLIDSQANIGGLAGVLREAAVSDFVDAHGFWDRPRGGGPWSIRNQPQVSALDGGTLGMLASHRVFGKPFTVSEFGVPAANDYAVEMFPLMVGIAGLQDWDALYASTYAEQPLQYEPTRIDGQFELAGHPVKLAFLTMAASAFRRELVTKALGHVELAVPEQPQNLAFSENALPTLWGEQGVPVSAAARTQLGITLHPGSGQLTVSEPVPVSGTLGSDTGQLLWERVGAHPRFSVDAPALKLVCGRVATSVLQFADVSFEFGDFAGGYACASLVALDDQPIARSSRLLLTVASRAENAHRPQLPTGPDDLGEGPALVQFVPFGVGLPRAAWRATALDAAGKPSPAVALTTSGQSRLVTALRDAALSYVITR